MEIGGLGFKVFEFRGVWVQGFRGQGLGFRVPGLRVGVSRFRCWGVSV